MVHDRKINMALHHGRHHSVKKSQADRLVSLVTNGFSLAFYPNQHTSVPCVYFMLSCERVKETTLSKKEFPRPRQRAYVGKCTI